MDRFENIFDQVYDLTKNLPQKHELTKSFSSRAVVANEALDNLPKGPQDEFFLQSQLRPVFGKVGINESPIGTHPDFIQLEGTDTGTIYHYVCTLFIDIKGSTRLNLLYEPELVYLFKNAVIKTCIEVVRSLDGHVHRIMGDAVMAFFGGNNIEKENAIADATNCSITLRTVLEESIKPWMERNGLDSKDFGFRIGCDFGDDTEVLWGSFGYYNVSEVSATGLPVDMASKLQHLANKNQTMLGQGLLDFINWPDKYSKIKETEKNGTKTLLPCVLPNLTNADGVPLNYKMKLLEYDKCLEYIAFPVHFKEQIKNSKILSNHAISYKCYSLNNGNRELYISGSKFLEKDIDLRFEVSALTKSRLRFPLRVEFSKTNHGIATPEKERDIEQDPKIYTLRTKINKHNKSPEPISKIELEEYTAYRGLHTMKCEVYDNINKLVFRDWIGVFIK
nr:adenylate/guanylate cyclase domain-containing protein [uncultured Desulfobacter sp.]